MPIQDLIEVASGTVTGRDHTFGGNLVLGKPNQDAIATAWTKDAFVAVLCDGCSSGEHSEVGAHLIARLLLREIVWQMDESCLYLASLPGVWSFGDCDVWHDGKLNHTTYPGNAPPYLAYKILPWSKVKLRPEELSFRPIVASDSSCLFLDDVCDTAMRHLKGLAWLLTLRESSTSKLVETCFLCTATVVIIDETVLDLLPIVVGTDGLADVPDPNVFLEDRMFTNPANVTRTLRKMNQPTVRIGGDPPRLIKTDGVLPDDTTLVAIRRKPCA